MILLDNYEKHEKYFTKTNVAVNFIKNILENIQINFNFLMFINNQSNYHFIEPYCGTGEFIKALKQQNIDNIKLSCIDIDEVYEDSILGDFLKIEKS